MRTRPAWLALIAAGFAAAPAGANQGSGEVWMGPMSVALQGGAPAYGSYDALRGFSNPALLANQPRRWEAAFSNRFTSGADQLFTAAAASWVGEPGELGTFGVAALVTRLGFAEIRELDLLGHETGLAVSPALNGAGLAVLYQWKFVGLGLGGLVGGWDLGSPGGDPDLSLMAPGLNFGTMVSLGRLDLGAAYRFVDGLMDGAWHLGLAIRTGGRFEGAVGVTADIQSGTDSSNNNNSPSIGFVAGPAGPGTWGRVEAGVNWEALRWIAIRAGTRLAVAGELATAWRFGFAVPWQAWNFEYAVDTGGEGFGAAHAIGVGRRFGAGRKQAETPKFFLTQQERTLAVANFDAQNLSAGDAAVISDMLRNRLIAGGAFNIVEKANMDKVLQEQAFQQTGCTTSECAVRLGKILNVRYLVVGSFGKALDQFVVSMRVIDIETAKAVYSDESVGRDLAQVREGIAGLAERLAEAVRKAR